MTNLHANTSNIVWKRHLNSLNFIPYLSQSERKLCSYIAIGEALPDVYYVGLRDYLTDDTVDTNNTEDIVQNSEM